MYILTKHLTIADSGTTSVVYWSDFLAADPEVPCSIPGVARFSK
jgi:hypothetical protein